MIPSNQLSGLTEALPFLLPDKKYKLVDHEWGGIALNNATQGLLVQIWKVYYLADQVRISSPNGVDELLFIAADISELSLAFDQNMRPNVAYVQDGICKLWWYDSSLPGLVTTVFGDTYKYPKLSMDDGRPNQIAVNDIIFAYVRNGTLNFRIQRERYLTEHPLGTPMKRLIQIGMTTGLRFQFKYR